MSSAARLGDLTIHGGVIVNGEPTVLIGGRPAARKGDPQLCPRADAGKLHIGGNIITSSRTVLIGGLPAARIGDMCGCPSTGKSGAGAPPVVGPNTKPVWLWTNHDNKTIEDLEKRGPVVNHAQMEFFDRDRNGIWDGMRFRYSAAHIGTETPYDIGAFELTMREQFDWFYIDRSLYWSDQGFTLKEEAGMARVMTEDSIGPPGKSTTDPFARHTTEAHAFTTDLEVDALVGDDKERFGLYGLANAEADAVGAEEGVGVDVTGLIPGFYHRNVRLDVSLDVDAGEGEGVGGGVLFDKRDDRVHIRLFWGLGIPLPFDVSLDLSFGEDKKEKSLPVPALGGPNVIVTGEATVLIG